MPTKIAKLQHDIHLYKKRITANSLAHKKRQENLQRKVKSWTKELKKAIEDREKLKKIAKEIKLDTKFELRNSAKTKNKGGQPALYKVLIENGFKSDNIAEFVGSKNPDIATTQRRAITKKLSNPKKRKIYNNMKKYVENEYNGD